MNEFIEVLTDEKNQLVNITEKVEKIIEKSGVKNGLALIFSFHTSATILINEDEPGLKKDWFKFVGKLTSGLEFFHDKIDNNASAHLISGLLGNEKTLPVENGKLLRGTWQEIFLMELDGPRTRKVLVKVINNFLDK
jgi:secondary thiamine-phosphate synthase enzyme